MKKIILLLMVLFVVSSIGFASNDAKIDKTQTVAPQVKNISIDLGDITNMTTCELTQLINGIIVTGLPDLPVLQCSVTVKANLNIGLFSFEITVTVSGDCAEIRASGTAIAYQIIAAIKSYLESFI
ncbi:MAG: hypothetical protein NTZ69_05620 [Bacteroidia bacterium]|nr:hypothetical protein [Bacteroidia bacterium]